MSEATASVPVTTNVAAPIQAETPIPVVVKEESESNMYSYIFIGVLSVVLLLLLYYAYSRFVSNSIKDPFVKGNQQERDDPVVDFNLREAIDELRQIQGRVLKTLSEQN